ncbi:DUF2267 domain-containing protein [Streptomyces indicus]|uniref:Uncharacterized conserved protein, DUF2267 family n=1 Tax=Streptomyces indicus TaxID=417292 RepID=A0A1G8XT04_9ACTN|nr:DUF2267 domain-containing protein [Streptomyces indicus]SDJ93025.1 Uncharacterized conserved protein, DUF2267 family [Streptomyces indicus]
MPYADFLAAVRRRGDYADNDRAADAADAVITVLGERLPPASAGQLAEQLPPRLGKLLANAHSPAQTWGVHGFVRRVADVTGDPEDIARTHTAAVLGVLADTVSGGELNKLISQLPVAYAEFLGHEELT